MSDATVSNCTCGTCDACVTSESDLLCEALCEAAQACGEVGAPVTFYVREEGDVERDSYRSIKDLARTSSVTIPMCAMNITWTPSQNRREKAGLALESAVLIYTPTQWWINAGIDFLDIDIIRTTVVMGRERFSIREKGRANVIVSTVPLYYTFGLEKVR